MWKPLSIFAAVLLAGSAAVSYLKQASIAEAKSDLEQAQKNRSAINDRLDDANKSLETKKADLEQAKTDNEADAETLTNLDSEIETLKADLEVKNEEKADRESALSELREKIAIVGEIEDLNTKMAALRADKGAADATVNNLKSQLASVIAEKESTDSVLQGLKTEELDKSSGRMPASFTGRVSEVSSQLGYIVIAAGDSQSVVNDAKLDVIRGGEVIGQIKVSSIEPSRSIADIVPGSFVEGSSVRPGDQLRVNADSKAGS